MSRTSARNLRIHASDRVAQSADQQRIAERLPQSHRFTGSDLWPVQNAIRQPVDAFENASLTVDSVNLSICDDFLFLKAH
jgi:hypothetical protein